VFDLSPEKLFILAIVAMFVLGPERLPTAASWLAKTLRQIKNYTADANQRIRSELGPEFDEIRQPLDDLRIDWTHLRTWRDPRTALTHHLRDNPITTDHYPSLSKGAPEPAVTHSITTTARRRGASTHRPRRNLTFKVTEVLDTR
jgi:sec-independent protein translocase protein TatB